LLSLTFIKSFFRIKHFNVNKLEQITDEANHIISKDKFSLDDVKINKNTHSNNSNNNTEKVYTNMYKFVTSYNEFNRSTDSILKFLNKIKGRHEKDKFNKNEIPLSRKKKLEDDIMELMKRNPSKFDFKHLHRFINKFNSFVLTELGEV